LVLILLLVTTLTLLGSAALLMVTLKYYWGERGTPPLTGDERRRQHEEELTLRAGQIEYAKNNPVRPRNPDFWDNRNVKPQTNTRKSYWTFFTSISTAIWTGAFSSTAWGGLPLADLPWRRSLRA
jgi:hypothetical protein